MCFSFGQNRGKRFQKSMTQTTFNDVAGVDEAKKELVEIVDFLKNPGKYKNLEQELQKVFYWLVRLDVENLTS